MPPKTQFEKEDVLNAAFDIVQHDGIDSLTARAIAKRLGSSVAPIYANYENLEELDFEIQKKIDSIFNSIVDQNETDDPFLNMGIRNIRFAIRYPNLYSYLIKNDNKQISLSKQHPQVIKLLKQNDEFKGLSDEEIGQIFLQLYVFTQGICYLIIENKFSGNNSETDYIDLLFQTGDAIINHKISSFK